MLDANERMQKYHIILDYEKLFSYGLQVYFFLLKYLSCVLMTEERGSTYAFSE